MRRFGVLLIKELRELITPQLIIPLVVAVLMFMALGDLIGSQADDKDETVSVVVVDADGTELSKAVSDVLTESGFKVRSASTDDTTTAFDEARHDDVQLMVTVPEGFEASVEAEQPLPLGIVAEVRGFSLVGGVDASRIRSALDLLGLRIGAATLERKAPGTNPSVIMDPIPTTEVVWVGERSASASVEAVMGIVMQQTMFLPVILFIVVMMAAQMIATAIATEKENKTLETLLSYPVSRASIVCAKMLAAALMALLMAGAYMYGLDSYQSGLTAGLGDPSSVAATDALKETVLVQLGLQFGPLDYVMLGMSLFAGILVALAMSTILGVFADSVKSVQSLITPVMVLLLIPYLLTMFIDVNEAPVAIRWLVYAIPFSHTFLASSRLYLDAFGPVLFGIAYQLIWFGVLIVIAARIFSTDRVLTMRLSLPRRLTRMAKRTSPRT